VLRWHFSAPGRLNMQLSDIQKQMMKTFLHLRVGIGVLGIVFPFLLWWGGRIVYHLPQADSMSAYYHATTGCIDPRLNNDMSQCVGHSLIAGQGPMRDWFVGILFAIGVGLFLIKGFSVWEDWLLTVPGALAVVVATSPMPWEPAPPTWKHVHYIAAVTFFVLIGLVIWVCSDKTLNLMPSTIPNRAGVIKHYKYTYRLLAIMMAISPFAAILLFKVLGMPQGIFWAEAAGVISFGAYWLGLLVSVTELHHASDRPRLILVLQVFRYAVPHHEEHNEVTGEGTAELYLQTHERAFGIACRRQILE
jgi:hypothetical protein